LSQARGAAASDEPAIARGSESFAAQIVETKIFTTSPTPVKAATNAAA